MQIVGVCNGEGDQNKRIRCYLRHDLTVFDANQMQSTKLKTGQNKCVL